MVATTLWTLWSRNDQPAAAAPHRSRTLALGAGFFAVGFYGGFIQAGVGFLLLAATTAAGLDLVRGNAVKVLAVLCFTSISLAFFAWQVRVVWGLGLCLAAGNVLGGLRGARLTVKKGHGWVKNVVTVTILIFAVKLLME